MGIEKPSFNTLIANPYFLNGASWLLVLIVYQLGWSELCPPLSWDVSLFMAITIIISFFAGGYTYFKGSVGYEPLKRVRMKGLWVICAVMYILFFAECAYSGGVPLLGYLHGSVEVSYKEFGVPIVHPIMVNGMSCLILYSFYAYRSMTEKRVKRRLMLLILVSIFPFVLMFNRGAVLSILIGFFLLLLLTTKRPARMIGGVALGMVGILFLFGLLGNLRMGKNMNDLILKVGRATTEFQQSSVPDEFFWGYLYVATPLGNVQNTINRTNKDGGDSDDLQNMILYEFTPELITKRIQGDSDKDRTYKRHRSKLLTENLNATSVYGRPFKYLGWTGMWLMFAFIMVFIAINLKIVPKSSKWFIPTLITLDEIIILNLFDNMFIFMGMIPQLAIFVGLYLWDRITGRDSRAD